MLILTRRISRFPSLHASLLVECRLPKKNTPCGLRFLKKLRDVGVAPAAVRDQKMLKVALGSRTVPSHVPLSFSSKHFVTVSCPVVSEVRVASASPMASETSSVLVNRPGPVSVQA